MHFQKPPLGTPLDWENPLNDGCVLHFAMNEGHGDKVQDLSMNGNHGTLNNFVFPPTVERGWNPGQTGIELKFDGTNDYVNCGHSESITPGTSDFTLSAMAKLDDVAAATFTALFGKGDTGAGEWMFRFNSTTEMSFYSGATYAACVVPNIVDGWQHYCFVRSGGDCHIYAEGIEYGSDPIAVNLTTTKDLRIGNADGAVNRFIDGMIDQPRIMNRAWTAKEVKDYAMNPWQVYLDV